MSKVAGVLTQAQITRACKGAFNSGAKRVTVEATLPNGTKMKITASADEPVIAKQSNDNDEKISAQEALATWQKRKTKNEDHA